MLANGIAGNTTLRSQWLRLTRDRIEMQETHLQSTISGVAAHAVSLNETTRPNGPTPQNKLGSPQEQALASEWCKHNLKDVSKYRRALARPHYLSTTLLHWQAAFFFFLCCSESPCFYHFVAWSVSPRMLTCYFAWQ